ncbi:MAG: ATP synthase F1 subunit delta [Candidatus Rokuibacteriota bacterium]
MPGQGVARPYARALHDLARERGQSDAVARELDTVLQTIAGAPELGEFFGRPWVPAPAKRNAAVEIALRLGVSQLTRDFVGLVARQGRAGDLAAIVAAYHGLVDESLGRVRAKVRTAVRLTDDERRQLAERLGRALGGKQVVVEEAVDPGLLGGFVAEVGSYIVDGSLDGQLARMQERLARG